MFRRFLVYLMLALGAAGAASAAPASQWVMGYYVAYQRDWYPPEAIEWKGLSHIIMGRIKANADGSINSNFDWDANQGPALAKDIAQRAHAAGKKAILMLGGDDNGAEILEAVTHHRPAFIANLIATMTEYGYDGLDLDWENNIDWALYQSFVEELRQAAPKAILTIPNGPLNINYDVVDPHWPAIARQVDRLNLMSYFPATSWVGSGWQSWFNSPLKGAKPTTPVSIDDSLARYVAAGVPKSKLGMGISFYATCYNGGITGPNQSTESGVTILGGDNRYRLSDLFGTGSTYAQSDYRWSTEAAQPYLSRAKPDGYGCRYTTFEDEASILAKGKFSRAHGYGGIIVWTINQGYVKSHARPNFLMEALDKAFLHPAAPQTVGVSVLQGPTWLGTGAQLSFNALVTGTTHKAVNWAVVEPHCGQIDARGRYTAPAFETTCTVTATSVADPNQVAKATVSMSNAPWKPSFSLSRSGQWWVEIKAQDPSVASMEVVWPDGTTSPLFIHYIEWGTGFPIFAANYGFPDEGGTYTFRVKSDTNRLVRPRLKVPACVHGEDGICH